VRAATAGLAPPHGRLRASRRAALPWTTPPPPLLSPLLLLLPLRCAAGGVDRGRFPQGGQGWDLPWVAATATYSGGRHGARGRQGCAGRRATASRRHPQLGAAALGPPASLKEKGGG
jgi:hypothetical protein